MTRAEMEMKVRGMIRAHTGAREQWRDDALVDELLELFTEPADNFSCAVPIAEQIKVLDLIQPIFPGRGATQAAIESLKWLDCYMRGQTG